MVQPDVPDVAYCGQRLTSVLYSWVDAGAMKRSDPDKLSALPIFLSASFTTWAKRFLSGTKTLG